MGDLNKDHLEFSSFVGVNVGDAENIENIENIQKDHRSLTLRARKSYLQLG